MLTITDTNSKDVKLNQLALTDLINYSLKHRSVNLNWLVLAKSTTYSTLYVCYCKQNLLPLAEMPELRYSNIELLTNSMQS